MLLTMKRLVTFFLLFINYSWAETRYDTIVIGSGVSGLAAASQLHNAQKEVLVLEARNRPGGRVHTTYDWGFSIEMGASWVHGIHNNPLRPLMDQQLTVLNSYDSTNPTGMLRDFALYTHDGTPVSKQSLALFSSLTKEFIKYSKNRNKMNSFEQLFKELTVHKNLTKAQSELLHYALENIYTYEYGENLTKLSPNALTPYDRSSVSGTNALLPRGYFKIFQHLTDDVPVKFNQRVKQIEYNRKGVRVITQNETYHAKRVIVTVPLGVLKAKFIKFHPALPKYKLKAIDELQMGNYEKLYLLFDEVFWDKNKEWIGLLPKNKYEGFNIFNYYKYTQKPVLIAFTGGQLAREMDIRDSSEWIMKYLRKIYGDNIPDPIKIKKTHWKTDPFSLGSYSYLPIGVDKQAVRNLAKPVAGRLFFAGEATSDTDPGTVHGAYQSGIRAADEIIAKRK